MKIYLIGSLRNSRVSELGVLLRAEGHVVFDDWVAAGPEADDYWQKYEQNRGRTYIEALSGFAARHIFEYDRKHLLEADVGVLILPAGKSAHLELGVLIGRSKKTYILLEEEPERFEVMYCFANGVFNNKEDLLSELNRACQK